MSSAKCGNIDYLSTRRQVQSLILALNLNVVTLIKDLNGNHVIQKLYVISVTSWMR
jgi:hypothetical protein